MRNFISEDEIEVAVLQKLSHPDFGYDIINCDPSPDKREDLNDGTGRSSKKECVLPCILIDITPSHFSLVKRLIPVSSPPITMAILPVKLVL